MNKQQKRKQLIAADNNPYPGLKPYTAKDQTNFFGRQTACNIMIDKILTHRLTLLFAASGVGKSSLLQAAIIPKLSADNAEGENLDVIYYMDWVSHPLENLSQHIIATLIDKQRLPDDFSLDELSHLKTLEELLRFCSAFVRLPMVLVLDQFEEFFRYQSHNEHAFKDFIHQLTQVITTKTLPVNVVISMREDFALELNAFRPRLPTILFENFYRLEKLDQAGATAAISNSVTSLGYHYEEALLKELVDDLLSQELKWQTDLLITDHAVASVEPPYLQIICYQLWNLNCNDPSKTLRLDTYQQAGKTEGLLKDFLVGILKDFSYKEKKLASAAFDYLVAQRGVKVAYPVTALAKTLRIKEDILEPVLAKLASNKVRLLRAQQRGDNLWYELYHDMFSPSIEQWNDSWKKKQQKKQRWTMGSSIIILVVVLGILIDAFVWVLDNNLPPGYLFKQQVFHLMDWGLKDEPALNMVEIKTNGKDNPFKIGELNEAFIAKTKRDEPKSIAEFGIPSHTATLNKNFYASQYEVTYEQYDYYVWQQRKMGSNNIAYPPSSVRDNQRGKKPVTYVSQQEAVAYTQWLSQKTGENYRLPTEIEWEYAARANSTTAYWWDSEDGYNNANCKTCGSEWDGKFVAPIGEFETNAFGLYDTAGNVWEWTCSTWQEKLKNVKPTCPNATETATSGRRVIRGGSWNYDIKWLRSSARTKRNSSSQKDYIGFRIFRFVH